MPDSNNIYIARGDETLGPYTLEEAARLIEHGWLYANDLAAKDGDGSWVHLSTLLQPGFIPEALAVAAEQHRLPVHGPVRSRRFTRRAAWWVAGGLLVGGGWLGLRQWGAPGRTGQAPTGRSGAIATRESVQTPSILPAPPTVNPPPMATPQPVATPPNTPQPTVQSSRLSGIVMLTNPNGTAAKLAGVRVAVYPLDAVLPALFQKKAQAQAAADRLAPEIEAAGKERTAREIAERAALRASLDAAPTDPLGPSLRFAHEQAKVAVKAAEDDYRFLLGQRQEAMDGEPYFRDLPDPVATALTNENGEYKLELPAGGQFAVAAWARPDSVPGRHPRYWFVKVTLDGGATKTLQLADDNVASADSPDSLLKTAD